MRTVLLISIIVGVLAGGIASRPKKFFLDKDGTLTKHHIIPGNTVLEFYQTALRQRHTHSEIETGLQDTLQHIARTSGYNGVDVDKLQKIRDGNMNFNRYTMSLFYWMQGNLFVGPHPEHRLDDPGSGFEDNARHIIPQSSFRNLHDIYNGMKRFIRTETPQDFIRVNDKIKNINRSAPYSFDPSQWSGNCNSQCSIKTSHSQPAHSHPSSSTGHASGHRPRGSGHGHRGRGRRPHHRP